MITTENTMIKILQKYGISYYLAKEDVTAGQDILCKICQNITFSDFGIIETTYSNPNVMIEFGILLGKKKPVFLLRDTSRSPDSIPSDIIGLERIHYKNQETLSKLFEKGIKKFIDKVDLNDLHLRNLVQQAKHFAGTNDYALLDSSLQTIFNMLVLKADKKDQFLNLLQEITQDFIDKGNLNCSLRFGLAGIRLCLMDSNKEKALLLYDQLILILSRLIIAFQANADRIVQRYPKFLELSKNPVEFNEFWNYQLIMNDFKNPEVVEFYYAYMWYGLKNSVQPESWLKELLDWLMIPILKEPLSWEDIHYFPWQGYMHHEFFPILWLTALQYSEIDNKEAQKIVKNTIDDIRNSFDKIFLNVLEGDDWSGDFAAAPRPMKKILESKPFLE